jgi:hypothetical protein
MEKGDAPDPKYQETYQLLPELEKVRDAIAPLPIQHRLAFALCCCERLYPSYQALVDFLKTRDLIRPILDRLWTHVLGQDLHETEVEQGMALCSSIPFGEEGCSEYVQGAIDAVGAVYNTLRSCKEYNLDNVVSVAEIVRENVDRPLWNELAQQCKEGVGPDEVGPIERAIRSHPSMITEIETEASQLRFLTGCGILTKTAIAQLLSLGQDKGTAAR